MKANELRIGNIIALIKPDQCITLRVDGITLEDIIVYGGYFRNELKIDMFEPVPLTEEWLERFGFEKKYKCFVKEDFVFIIGHGLAYKLTLIANSPEYVHQLQNLYFALTGEELEIKNY
jgi:hypothetical protein